ncbi:hypothetical protein Cantr_01650 [Candida viswanathii]|uniref:Uncharacterized protein n=1 Tax=Candida viswanathii TaxID=5486 RepID=A0A367YM14_9ASCO|nr:hypothetical protein Cantr_01650 [Candida viswanathii]
MNLFDLPLEILLKIVKYYQQESHEQHAKIISQLHVFLKDWCYYQLKTPRELGKERIWSYKEMCESRDRHTHKDVGLLSTEIDHVEYFVKLNETGYTVYYPDLLLVKNKICLLMQGNQYLLSIRKRRPYFVKDVRCLGRKASLSIFQLDKLWAIPDGLIKLKIHSISCMDHINLTNAQGLRELKLSFAESYNMFPTWIAGGLPCLKRLKISFKVHELRHQSWSSMMHRVPNISCLEVECANLKFYNIMRCLGEKAVHFIKFTMHQQHYTVQELHRTLKKAVKPDGSYVLDLV